MPFAAGLFLSVWCAIPTALVADVQTSRLGGWREQTTGDSTVSFESGAGEPGRARFQVDESGETVAQLSNWDYHNTPLGLLTALSYQTFVKQNGGGLNIGDQAVYLVLQVDYDNDGGADDLLFFEPAYQNTSYLTVHAQQPVALNSWQEWDALSGGWWSLKVTAGAAPGMAVKSLQEILRAQPHARIVNDAANGGVRLVAGLGSSDDWGKFIGSADLVTVRLASRTPEAESLAHPVQPLR